MRGFAERFVLPEPGPLPPGSHLLHEWHVMFTGREAELKELARLLLYEVDGGMWWWGKRPFAGERERVVGDLRGLFRERKSAGTQRL